MPDPCGCHREGHYLTQCHFHWNESNIRMELDRARQWDSIGTLNPDDPSDQQVIRFFDQLCYWAAKGIGDSGSVGSIYSAKARKRTNA